MSEGVLKMSIFGHLFFCKNSNTTDNQTFTTMAQVLKNTICCLNSILEYQLHKIMKKHFLDYLQLKQRK